MRAILQMIAFLAAGHIGANAVCKENLDLVFVVDGSSTICGSERCANWDSILQFIRKLAESLEIGSHKSRVALVTFSDQAEVKWNLNKYTDKTELLSATDKVEYPGGELNTSGALKIIVTDIFTSGAGDRSDFKNVAILITDGAPKIDPKIASESSKALQERGIEVFVVCVTSRCPEIFAHNLSSPPKKVGKTYFLAEDYSSIDDVRKKLVHQICAHHG